MEWGSLRRSYLCCRSRNHGGSSPATLSKPPSPPSALLQQKHQQCSGLDPRSLRRWLATEMVDASTSERARTSQFRSHRRQRSSTRRCDDAPSFTAYETVELTKNWTDEPTDPIDRPMAKLPCEIFLNRLLRTKVRLCIHQNTRGFRPLILSLSIIRFLCYFEVFAVSLEISVNATVSASFSRTTH